MNEAALKSKMDKTIDAFKHDLGGLRTGRASAELLSPVMVEAYGQSMPLNQVGNVAVTDSRLITVQVWDKSMVDAVEKAIRESGLGLNPVTEGQTIRVPLPALTEERRKELIKVARKYAEDSRVAIRNQRRDAMDDVKKAQKDGEMSEDEARRASDVIQKVTDDFVSKIDTILAGKEEDIMKV